MKKQEGKGLLSNLKIKTRLSKIPLLKIVNKFLLMCDIFMTELYIKQHRFTSSACGPFTRNKERNENCIQTGNTDFSYRNVLDKACFQHDIKRVQSDKVLRDETFKVSSDPKYDGYQRGLALHKFLDKESSGSGVEAEPNYQLANKLHRQIPRKFQR